MRAVTPALAPAASTAAHGTAEALRHPVARPLPATAATLVLALACYFPALLAMQGSLPTSLTVAVIVAAVLTVVARRSLSGVLVASLAFAVAGLSAAALITQVFGLAHVGGPFVFLSLLPATILLGYEWRRCEWFGVFVRWYRLIAVPVSVAAVIERAFSMSIFGLPLNEQFDRVRATVGQFYPIILSTFLCIAIVTLVEYRSWILKALLAAVYLVGITSTDSQGPLAVAVVAVVLVLAPPLRRLFRYTGISLLAVGALLAFLSIRVWTTTIAGDTVADYSNGYRASLYAVAADIVRTQPFGYGFDGLPTGVWSFESQYLGAVDVAWTVDSELVLLVTEFGIIGAAFFFFVLWRSGKATYRGSVPGLMLFVLTLNGFTVALLPWLNVPLLAGLLAGASLLPAPRAGPPQRPAHHLPGDVDRFVRHTASPPHPTPTIGR